MVDNKLKRLPPPANKNNWHEIQKSVTAALQNDEDAHIDTQFLELEQAASKRENGSVWKIIGQIAGLWQLVWISAFFLWDLCRPLRDKHLHFLQANRQPLPK